MLAFLSSANSVVALLEKFIEGISSVHILEEFSLHLILCEPTDVNLVAEGRLEHLLDQIEHNRFGHHINQGLLDDVVV